MPKNKELTEIFFLAYFFAYSLAFAGAAAIKRFPLLKTLLFVGLICGSCILYIYILLEKFDLASGLEFVG